MRNDDKKLCNQIKKKQKKILSNDEILEITRNRSLLCKEYKCTIAGCSKTFLNKFIRDRHSANPKTSLHKKKPKSAEVTTEICLKYDQNQAVAKPSKTNENVVVPDTEKNPENKSAFIMPFRFLSLNDQITILKQISKKT